MSWRDTAEVRHERQVAEYPDTGERPSCLNPKVSAEREGSDPSPSRRTAGARRHDKQVGLVLCALFARPVVVQWLRRLWLVCRRWRRWRVQCCCVCWYGYLHACRRRRGDACRCCTGWVVRRWGVVVVSCGGGVCHACRRRRGGVCRCWRGGACRACRRWVSCYGSLLPAEARWCVGGAVLAGGTALGRVGLLAWLCCGDAGVGGALCRWASPGRRERPRNFLWCTG